MGEFVGIRLRHACLEGVRYVGIELVWRVVEDRNAQDRQFAQRCRHAAAIANRGEHLFPAMRERWAVEQHLVQRRDAPALGDDRGFLGCQLGAAAWNDGR